MKPLLSCFAVGFLFLATGCGSSSEPVRPEKVAQAPEADLEEGGESPEPPNLGKIKK